jgi:hypothetical protein
VAEYRKAGEDTVLASAGDGLRSTVIRPA